MPFYMFLRIHTIYILNIVRYSDGTVKKVMEK